MSDAALDPDRCYDAVLRRDPREDGRFFTGVTTTRIYCRNVCPARPPRRGNVRFFRAAAQAHAAGFRPCLRCRPESAPDSPAWAGSLASVNRALRRIEEGALAHAEEGGGGLEALADGLGMTSRHLRRLFVQRIGLTPGQVEAARRLNLAKALLHQTALPSSAVAFAAGYGSLRRFNEAFRGAFGRPPSEMRRPAAGADTDRPARADALSVGPAAPLHLVLNARPPFDWPARLAAHPLAAGEEVDAEGALHAALPEGGRMVLRPCAGADALVLELWDAPLSALARAAARARRDFLWDEDARRAG